MGRRPRRGSPPRRRRASGSDAGVLDRGRPARPLGLVPGWDPRRGARPRGPHLRRVGDPGPPVSAARPPASGASGGRRGQRAGRRERLPPRRTGARDLELGAEQEAGHPRRDATVPADEPRTRPRDASHSARGFGARDVPHRASPMARRAADRPGLDTRTPRRPPDRRAARRPGRRRSPRRSPARGRRPARHPSGAERLPRHPGGYHQLVGDWPSVQRAIVSAIAQGLHRAR
ncbi:hypothetical protein SAMN05880568_1701 [Microbacterium sp. RURRCA19A]|nr:hypothetical protein SAMN05880568_1701 [Microbacterium sp. RURRCA19A]